MISKNIYMHNRNIYLPCTKPKIGLEPNTSTSPAWEEKNIPYIQDRAGMFKSGDQH
jgi:predicted lipoprotein